MRASWHFRGGRPRWHPDGSADPNESDDWEVFNRVLCLRLLDTYPTVAKVTNAIEVYPTFGIQYAHTSRCAVVRDDGGGL